MLLLSSLHVHDQEAAASADCKECVDHHPHAGHIGMPGAAVHTCVLCQFLTLPFVAAAIVAAALYRDFCKAQPAASFRQSLRNSCGIVGLRAPPASI